MDKRVSLDVSMLKSAVASRFPRFNTHTVTDVKRFPMPGDPSVMSMLDLMPGTFQEFFELTPP